MRPDNPGDKSLPPGWDAFSLGSKASFVTSGSRGWARFYTETGDLFLRSQNVRSGRLDLEDRQHVLPPAGAEGERTRVQPNDLLVTITGNSVGNVAISSDDLGIAYISQHVGLIRLVNPSLAPYACWYLSPGAPGNRQIMDAQTGQSKPGLNLQNLKDLVVAAPKDKRERDLIVTALDDIQAHADEMQMLLSKKRMLKQAAMQELLTGKRRLPGFEWEWEVKRLGDVAPLQRGFDLPNPQLKIGPYPVVYSNGVMNHHVNFQVKGPGVVTGRSGTIGNVHFIDGDYWPHNTSLWVTNFKGNDPKFVFYLLSQLGLERFASGSGVPTLNRNDIHDYHVRIPGDVVEQTVIASVLTEIDSDLLAAEKQMTKYRYFKQGMMQQLLTGKIRLT